MTDKEIGDDCDRMLIELAYSYVNSPLEEQIQALGEPARDYLTGLFQVLANERTTGQTT